MVMTLVSMAITLVSMVMTLVSMAMAITLADQGFNEALLAPSLAAGVLFFSLDGVLDGWVFMLTILFWSMLMTMNLFLEMLVLMTMTLMLMIMALVIMAVSVASVIMSRAALRK